MCCKIRRYFDTLPQRRFSKLNQIAGSKRLKEYIKNNNLELLENLENDSELRYLIFPMYWAIKEVDKRCGWTCSSWCGTCNAQHNAERIKEVIVALKKYQKLFEKKNRRLL